MSAITEIYNIFDSIAQYLRSKSSYVNAGGSTPSTSAIESFDFTEALSFVSGSVQSSADFSIGASQEAIFTAAAINRETEMSKLAKSSLYSNMISELDEDADFYSSSATYFSGVASGNPTTGSRS